MKFKPNTLSKDPVAMTWVREGDPLWDELSERWAATDDFDTKKPRRKRPPAIFSEHVEAENGPGWYFRTSWVADILSRQAEQGGQSTKSSTVPKIRNGLRNSVARQPKPGPEPWLPLKPDKRSETISAMERRWSIGKVSRHEYDTYAGTLRATAALLGNDDPDTLRCLELAGRVEEHAKLSDDAFVRKAMGWIGL